MSAIAGVIERLRTDASLGTLLATPESVWHRRAPSGAGYPRVIVMRLDDPSTAHLEGGSDIQQPLLQIDSIAETAEVVQAVDEAVTARLHGYRGALGDKWCSGFTRQSGRDSDVEKTEGSHARRYMVSSDYVMGWRA